MKKAGILAVILSAAALISVFALRRNAVATVPAGTSGTVSGDASAAEDAQVSSAAAAKTESAAADGFQTKELFFQRDGLSIYGQALIPGDGSGNWPVVIMEHGFSGSYGDNLEYAKTLAENGFAAYAFDFCGGSNNSRSDGSTTEMSILTEVSDLKAVLAGIRAEDFVNPDRIFLLGESQGGCVAALTAAQAGENIRGLVLLYPAFVIPDDARILYPDQSAVPDTIDLMGTKVGRNYVTDIWDLDVFGEISKYTGPVLIFHGTQDVLVPPFYSQKAADVYADARLVMIQDAGHGFYGDDAQAVGDQILDFLKNIT